MKPFRIIVGDSLAELRKLADESVNCCVTSPPYWGLRDYGTEGQLGLEASPDEYVAAMVAVFREVRRVLADHGTVWLNLGDSYANDLITGLKPKDLVGIPWRVAFALQADGWWLRSDIVWAKPNPMPESVTDRPTKAHEYVFLLAKRPAYWFDQEAVREPYQPSSVERDAYGYNHAFANQFKGSPTDERHPDGKQLAPGSFTGRGPDGRKVTAVKGAGRNVRSVWEIATQPYPEAHFATYPEELVRRCLLAGCPEWVCGVCGKPRERLVETAYRPHPKNPNPIGRADANGTGVGYRPAENKLKDVETVGWSDCGHNAYRPGTVLDPFLGSGTTAHVARKHGRRCVGIELNETYAALAARRLQQLSLLADGSAA